MVPHTRRRLLHVAAAGLGGLAGCNGLRGDTGRSTPTATSNEGVTGTSTATDPPIALLRANSATPPIRPPDFEPQDADESPEDRYSSRVTHTLLGSRADAEQCTVAPEVDGDADAVSAFVADTDFDEETLYLETNRLPECYRLELCAVTWLPDKIRTEYTRRLRPYDERCEADEEVFESRLIRLPVAVDTDAVHSFATSVGGSGRCDRGPQGRAGEASEGSEAASASERSEPTPATTQNGSEHQ